MLQTNAGVSFIGRLPQFVGTTMLSGIAVIAGLALFSNSPVQALPLCNSPANGGGGATIPTDTIGSLPVGITAACEFTNQGNIAGLPSWSIDLDIVPNLPATDSSARTFSYTLVSSGPNWIKAALSSNVVAGTGSANFTKELCNSAFTSCITIASLAGAGDTPFYDIPPAFQSPILYVRDTFQNNTGRVDNMSNTFQTPGPLPILGAGAAFGFSRKLRSRIKAGRTA